MNRIEVCYSPALFDLYKNKDAYVVVVDVLRATSSICTAFSHGVSSIIPVKTRDEAYAYKQKGFLVAAERDGIKLDFADFGNSPYNFSKENVFGKHVVYSTTNGTKTIQIAAHSKGVLIGAFSNITTLTNWIAKKNAPVIILCAGWKNKYNIEDSVFAGALTERLLATNAFYTDCDSAHAALDLWKHNKHDLRALIDICAQRERLRKNKLDDCIDFCLQLDSCNVVPIFNGTALVNAEI